MQERAVLLPLRLEGVVLLKVLLVLPHVVLFVRLVVRTILCNWDVLDSLLVLLVKEFGLHCWIVGHGAMGIDHASHGPHECRNDKRAPPSNFAHLLHHLARDITIARIQTRVREHDSRRLRLQRHLYPLKQLHSADYDWHAFVEFFLRVGQVDEDATAPQGIALSAVRHPSSQSRALLAAPWQNVDAELRDNILLRPGGAAC
mmetsp:Transcript_559/g.1339  ORF Transcript_559/g.1339 Transcript_559/m.1339 type:complete len:202 (+) Transcript_559:263-868(+)